MVRNRAIYRADRSRVEELKSREVEVPRLEGFGKASREVSLTGVEKNLLAME